MTVFKNYLKIAKVYIPVIIIYTFMFTTMAIIFSLTGNETVDFEETKPNITIINKDENTPFVNELKNNLSNKLTLVKIENNDEKIKDALFYRQTNVVFILPENFTEDFMNDELPKVEIMDVPGSYYSNYAVMILNRFLNISDTYVKTGMNEETIVKNIQKDFEKETKVILENAKEKTMLSRMNFFYNFSNYTILALCVMVVGMIMMSFTENNIKKRNMVSGTTYQKINISIFWGNFMIMTIIWLLFVTISGILYGSIIFTAAGLLIILNSFLFSISALTIGFFVGSLLRSREAMNGIVNVLAIGSSFLSGAFVPQEYLGKTVLSISKFFPSYWFITNNNYIANLSKFNLENLTPVAINMLMLVFFTLLFIIIHRIIIKYKLNKGI